MEHWLQLMCCTLAVILVLYFGDVREDQERTRKMTEVTQVDIQAKDYSRVSTSLYMEEKLINNRDL